MKNLSELSDEQKSVMLARLCGWLYREDYPLTRVMSGKSAGKPAGKPAETAPCVMCNYPGQSGPWGLREDLYEDDKYTAWERVAKNLYHPDNMALAWRVLNWASSNKSPHPEEHDEMQYKMQEWLTYHVGWLDILPPAEAQREWLDKILSLADEAGMVEVQNAND